MAAITPEMLAHNDGPVAVRSMGAIMAVTTIVITLRFATRIYRDMSLWIDDWLMLVAFFLAWTLFVVSYYQVVAGGSGKYLAVLLATDPSVITASVFWLFIAEYVYGTLMAVIKFSILSMYYRLFPTSSMRWSCIVAGGIVCAWWLAVVLVSTFQCNPIYKAWNPFMLEGTCIDRNKFFLGNSISNIITDIGILFLPMHEIYRLPISFQQKLAVSGLFLLAGLAPIVSIVRLKSIIDLFNAGANGDYTNIMAQFVIWSLAEPCIGMISISICMLRPLFAMMFRKAGQRIGGSRISESRKINENESNKTPDSS